MRAALVVALLASAAALAWSLLPAAADEVSLPAAAPAARPAAAPATPAPRRALPTRAEAAPEAAPSRARPAETGRQAPDEALSPPRGAAPASPVVVEVRHAGTGELVPAFSYRFVSGRAAPLRGEAAGRAALPLPRGVTGQLVLEADGLQPRVFEDLAVPPDAAPPLQLDVFLDPTRAAEGVTVWVRDADRRPVQDVRVDAFLLAADAPRGAWHLERPLWSRAASARDGRYRLPPLAPGRYGVRLTGVDEDGRPLPLTPSRRVFELTGGNGFVEDVTLEPACALQLDLVRPSGAAFRAAGRADVAIRLRAATEPALPRRWVSVGPDGARSSAVDRLPGPSPIWLAEATAPGAYVLEVAVDGVVQVQRQLVLAATAQTERVVLP